MTEIEYCAREGCGAPRAWHDSESSVWSLAQWDERPTSHEMATPVRDRLIADPNECVGHFCSCTKFVKPPEREAYVVMFDEGEFAGRCSIRTDVRDQLWRAIPLAEYLASHPQPDGPMCVCGGRADNHGGGGRCGHIAKFVNSYGDIEFHGCRCTKYEARP